MDTNDSFNTALVVTDDEGVGQAAVSSILEKAGFAVMSARNGVTALERIRDEQTPIDLAVIDTVLAGIQPLEVVRRLQAVSPQVRILFLYHEGDETVQTFASSGAVRRFLKKPFRRSKFLGEVLEMMDQPKVMSA